VPEVHVSTLADPSETERINAFLAAGPFAVVGASTDRSKYGNKVLRCYQQHGREVYPINPKAPQVEGLKAYPSLAALPVKVQAISVITPPAATEQVVREAHAAGVRHVWMQPGAESDAAIQSARSLGMNVIAGGPCVLVVMGYHE
jgi:predicted CoA-binding protein